MEGIVSFINPAKKKKTNPTKAAVTKYANAKKKKPAAKKKKPRRRRNPSMQKQIFDAFGVALPVVGSVYVTRYLTRAVMGDKDTGPLGYGVNFLTAAGLAMAAQFTNVGKKHVGPILVGGMSAIVLRIIADQFPAFAEKVGSIGDAGTVEIDMSPDESGVYEMSDYLTPEQISAPGNVGIPELDMSLTDYMVMGQ